MLTLRFVVPDFHQLHPIHDVRDVREAWAVKEDAVRWLLVDLAADGGRGHFGKRFLLNCRDRKRSFLRLSFRSS
jgi:hypothetical protein